MTDPFSSPPHRPPYHPPHPPSHPQHPSPAYGGPQSSPTYAPHSSPTYAPHSSPTYATPYPSGFEAPLAPPLPDESDDPLLHHHSDLRLLRSAYRWQRRVATLTALGYFMLFLTLSAFAPSFMTGTVTGGLSTGLLLGLLQVPVTCLAIWLYERTARRRVDPLADRIRRLAEAEARRDAKREADRTRRSTDRTPRRGTNQNSSWGPAR
ncbi:DUF485 domain-containing protein [Streptomyces neyagawaensis]|uniref:DUF485 domain-containing protein n=1 Tax=Streptomyces neyagawaensis TaxID=42238 RepID=UPI00201CF133|nr:DUF485 domain-containing protein [Streptomyces neyagawaensis]MCL6733027.1 DUF485 domain-containing protein [Streptomyces neyagawaensis]MDE1684888.1 DUF485 domain-containing protein [Streptomyces neyagawaensis]